MSASAMHTDDPNPLMILREDPANRVLVTIDRQTLSDTLKTLCKIGKQEPYALIYLKGVAGDRADVSIHIRMLQESKPAYQQILRNHGIMNQDGTVDKTVSEIAREAIRVLNWCVELRKPEDFKSVSVDVGSSNDVPDDDIGGVDYGDGDVIRFANSDE
jgi:hypothetical protein